jgi:NAD(P)-dependent dehydrogenase (short-subunit alcohol dehydrogenase family)
MTDRIAIVTGASGGIGRAVAARLGHAGMSSVPELTDDENHDDGVSPRAAKRLRDAMDRLLAGRPQRTDGRLLKDNLWKEAGLSRATMNRAVRILAEWNSRVAACEAFTPGEARKNDEITALRTRLADKTRQCTELHHRLDAAATAIAALHHENTLLRQELDQRGRLVTVKVGR